MKIFLTSIKWVNSLEPERLYVTVSAYNPEYAQRSDLSFTVELGADAMNLTLSQIEDLAAMKARAMLAELPQD